MADRAFIHRPFDDHIRMKPTGVLLAKLKGEAGFINVGDYESVSYSYEFEEDDIYSPQTPERSKIATLVSQADISLSFELAQLAPMFRTIAMQSEPGLAFAQLAAADTTYLIPDAVAGRIYPLPHRQVSGASVSDGTATVYVEGTHWQVDGATGHFEVVELPAGAAASPDLTVTYDAAAIAGRQVWGMLSKTDIRGSLMFRSTNRYGPRQLVEFWDVKFRPDGDQTLGSNSTDWANVSFTGEVFADPTREIAYQYGRVTDLPA